MPDYKKMYLKLLNATENAIEELIRAQRLCEELYMNFEDKENAETEETKKAAK